MLKPLSNVKLIDDNVDLKRDMERFVEENSDLKQEMEQLTEENSTLKDDFKAFERKTTDLREMITDKCYAIKESREPFPTALRGYRKGYVDRFFKNFLEFLNESKITI